MWTPPNTLDVHYSLSEILLVIEQSLVANKINPEAVLVSAEKILMDMADSLYDGQE